MNAITPFDFFKYDFDTLMQPIEYLDKLCRARVVCGNGATVSIKFGPLYRSSPTFDLASFEKGTFKFNSIEAGFPSADSIIPRSWLKYAEDRDVLYATVYNYLPCKLLIQFLKLNGGYVSGCLPPMKLRK
jgi:hypothetical protein